MQGIVQTMAASGSIDARQRRSIANVARFSIEGCACFIIPEQLLEHAAGSVVGALTLSGRRYAICTERRAADGRANPMVLLTTRELEIAALIADGYHNKEIARRLGISPFTVGAHLARAYSKLGVSSRSALAARIAGRMA